MVNKIKVHYSFYIFLFFVIYFNGFLLFLSYFISLFIHEYSHYLLSKKYNKMSHTINIYPFGMNVCVNINNRNIVKNFMVFLIGPLCNIMLLLITVSLWWYYPQLYFYTKDFTLANFCLGFFNLIPIYPLDGGNMFLTICRTYKSKQKVIKIMKISAIIFSLLFLILFIISCFSVINFSCFCISIFLFSSLFSYNDILNNEIKNRCLNNDSIKEYKAYVINLNTKLNDIRKCIDNNAFVQFYLLNENNKIVRVFTQDEILKLFEKSSDQCKDNLTYNLK